MEKNLTPKEQGLLNVLMENKGKICSMEFLYEQVWKQTPFDCSNIIMVHIRHLREKTEADPSRPKRILTVHNEGYCYL